MFKKIIEFPISGKNYMEFINPSSEDSLSLIKPPQDYIHIYASRLSDLDWLNLLIKSINEPFIDGIELPRFPSDDIQRQFVGKSGESTLQEAFNFYCILKKYLSDFDRTLMPDSQILDFGCGWGRIIRFFIKDVRGENLYGVDIDPEMISLCQETVRYGNYNLVHPLPPSELPCESFDVIYAYSVFSHLNEQASFQWVEEFYRILKPGGLLFVTTQGRSFIDDCRYCREHPNLESPWHQALATAFVDSEAVYQAYDRGEFLHHPTGGGSAQSSSFYGETLIPPGYVEREWTRFFSFRDFVDDRSILGQALIVMQKPLSYLSEIDPELEISHSLLVEQTQKNMIKWLDNKTLEIDEVRFLVTSDTQEMLENNSQGSLFVLVKAQTMISKYLSLKAENPKKIFEIGIFKGGSCVFFHKSFNPEKLVAVDYNQNPVAALDKYIEESNISDKVKPYYGVDQSDPQKMLEILESEFPKKDIDLVIDDGSHFLMETKASFNLIFPYLRTEGIYIIEDWGWAHYPSEIWQEGGGVWRDKPALTNLVIELMMLSVSRSDIVSEIVIEANMIFVKRGGAILNPKKFDISNFYLCRGKHFCEQPLNRQPVDHESGESESQLKPSSNLTSTKANVLSNPMNKTDTKVTILTEALELHKIQADLERSRIWLEQVQQELFPHP
ncbi:MAG: methyltransferase domain-containing protein [Microcoleus sp. PH2017_01_SCD_O_A]|uniref:methyltransferase domain-containing protein n=1 Tax=unclassified Microcoleus TaxID=2642155 RepID=UPI001D7A8573|nr:MULTISPECIES: class I SAM-dependent methyltransferase [unclassified Microcoleus]TAG65454.1 MAG: methyltransferase domain-containing protein [Oscillatoriales cyanobacterium]MCC3424652.1 methyltransferase domain-containing protein [Microcoleus sp. PH2017_01_SCD_O_A]MCC3454679.1 methyltransferase domain-containing protein [Microcoleus sp. PH2017_08_TRC_O_A]MCC3473372.1 methyltransferase domain-containing protein [Microcoleus sp. PH2017_13_LAR_U_A]MCC3485689.1 methyltransferase domain-containin